MNKIHIFINYVGSIKVILHNFIFCSYDYMSVSPEHFEPL